MDSRAIARLRLKLERGLEEVCVFRLNGATDSGPMLPPAEGDLESAAPAG